MLAFSAPSWTFDVSSHWSVDRSQPPTYPSTSKASVPSLHGARHKYSTRLTKNKPAVEELSNCPDKALPSDQSTLLATTVAVIIEPRAQSSAGLKKAPSKEVPNATMIIDLTDAEEPVQEEQTDATQVVSCPPTPTAPRDSLQAPLSVQTLFDSLPDTGMNEEDFPLHPSSPIFIQSPRPELAPHILISPPQDSINLLPTPMSSGVAYPQCSHFLVVPRHSCNIVPPAFWCHCGCSERWMKMNYFASQARWQTQFIPYAQNLLHESIDSSVSPHIVVTGPENQSFWAEGPVGPQDSGYLMVPPSRSAWSQPTRPPTFTFEYYDEDDYYNDEDDENPDLDLLDPYPEDIPEDCVEDYSKDYEPDSDVLADDTSEASEDSLPSPPSCLSYSTTPLPWTPQEDQWDKQFYIDEDDDELPPLDEEWYSRAGIVQP